MKLLQKALLVILTSLLLFSCSEYEQVLKGDNYDKKI